MNSNPMNDIRGLTLIDTNVILRYLLDDNEELALISEQIIEAGAWTTPEVLAEITYVLDCVYHVPRKSIASALQLVSNHVMLQPMSICLSAIQIYSDSRLNFVDCMIAAYHKSGITRGFTFDKELKKQLGK